MACEKDPLANDVRKELRARKLPPNPSCLCGEDRSETLEVHHPAGQVPAPDLQIVRCRNCHAVDSEGQRDVGADLSHRDGRTILDVIEAGLLSLAAFFESLAEQLCEWARRIGEVIENLDAWNPAWREQPGMLR